MISNNQKTFITYLGGSAGDLIAGCLNNARIGLTDDGSVFSMAWNLKILEPFDDLEKMFEAAQRRDYEYLSVHHFDLFLDRYDHWISLEISDPETQDLIIIRHLYLHLLRIEVNPKSDWFNIIKSMCLAKKYDAAAKVWFKNYQDFWKQEMSNRIQKKQKVPISLDLNELFDPTFSEYLIQRFDHLDPDICQSNHEYWLKSNQKSKWHYQLAIDSLKHKLSKMDWTQQEGTIWYQK